MESIRENQFNFIYLDLPWCTISDDLFRYTKNKKEDSYSELEIFLANQKGCETKDITVADIKAERLKRKVESENLEKKKYSIFISKILENSWRILNSTGILILRSPEKSIIDFKLMLDQVFSDTYIMKITLEKINRPWTTNSTDYMNQETLYLYSKTNEFRLNKIYEDFDSYSSEFKYEDDKDRYKLISLLSNNFNKNNNGYTWKGISPEKNQIWRFDKEKLDELYESDRIVIKNGKAFLKCYMKENQREKSTVWKASLKNHFNIEEKHSSTIYVKHFIDLINMVTNENDWIFSPFDVDQKLPLIAEKLGRRWVVINPTCDDAYGETYSYKNELSNDKYIEIKNIQGNTQEIVYTEILKNIDDINNLKKRLAQLNESVLIIKKQLGVTVEDEESVLEQIQERIDVLIEKSDIEQYVPIVQEWIKPFWTKLETESKQFLPTAELLYEEYKNAKKFDLSIAILSYCKALEKELYSKMFKGYIKKLINGKINVRKEFIKDFEDYETKKFAESIHRYTTKEKNNELNWKLELGTMVYILKIVLDDKNIFLNDGRIYADYRKYLEEQFESLFFDIKFSADLDSLAKLRNDSAHPNIVDSEKIETGKELAKSKLLEILRYHNK